MVGANTPETGSTKWPVCGSHVTKHCPECSFLLFGVLPGEFPLCEVCHANIRFAFLRRLTRVRSQLPRLARRDGGVPLHKRTQGGRVAQNITVGGYSRKTSSAGPVHDQDQSGKIIPTSRGTQQ